MVLEVILVIVNYCLIRTSLRGFPECTLTLSKKKLCISKVTKIKLNKMCLKKEYCFFVCMLFNCKLFISRKW